MPGAGSRIAVDTSIALPLLLRNHSSHEALVSWRKGRALSLCGHAWVETYAVLTRLPGSARVAPADAARALAASFSAPVWVKERTLIRAPETFAAAGIAGGAAYDAWIALAALDSRSVLASRDVRAEATYRRLGVEVEMVAA